MPKQYHCGVRFDLISVANVFVRNAIDCTHSHLKLPPVAGIAFSTNRIGCVFFPCFYKMLAMAAPWCVENNGPGRTALGRTVPLPQRRIHRQFFDNRGTDVLFAVGIQIGGMKGMGWGGGQILFVGRVGGEEKGC